MGLEELAAVGQWVAEVREELRRVRDGGYTESYRPPPMSSVLKDLAAGSLDEDKFIITRRVQHYFREAVRRARERGRRQEKEAPPPSLNRPRPPHPNPIPAAPRQRPQHAAQPSRPPPSHSSHSKPHSAPPRPQPRPSVRPPSKPQPPSRPAPPHPKSKPPPYPSTCPQTQPPSRPPLHPHTQPSFRPPPPHPPHPQPQLPSHPSTCPQPQPPSRPPPHPHTQPSSRPAPLHPPHHSLSHSSNGPQTQPTAPPAPKPHPSSFPNETQQPTTPPHPHPPQQPQPQAPSFPAYRPPPLFFQFPGVRKQSHHEHKTNRKRDEKRTRGDEGYGGTQNREAQKGKAEVVSVHRQEKPGKDQKPSLQVSTQASVDIPRGNTVERLPGISIEPEGDQTTPSKRRNVVFQVIHRNTDESSSPESSGGAVDGDGEGDDGGSSGGDGDEGFAASTNERDAQKEDEVRNGSQMRVDGGVQTSPQPPSPPPKPLVVPPTARNDEGDNHSSPQEPEHQEENLRSAHDGERNKTGQNTATRSESVYNAVGGSEGGVHDERLPGYLPEVVWREVTVGDHLEENTGDNGEAAHFLREAEERLRQHDLRQRILEKVAERIQDMVRARTGPAGDVAASSGQEGTAEDQPHDEEREEEEDKKEEEEKEQDLNTQSVVAATRAVLTEVVRKKLAAALLQVQKSQTEDSNHQAEQVSFPTKSSGGEEDAVTPPPVSPAPASPIHPPPPATPPYGRSPSPKTPAPSPPPRKDPPPKPPLTPQLSREEVVEEKREPVPTPPSSPPPASPPPAPPLPKTPPRTPTPPPPIRPPEVPTPQRTPEVSPSRVSPAPHPISPPTSPPSARVSVPVQPVRTPSPSDAPRGPAVSFPPPDTVPGEYITLIDRGTQADIAGGRPVGAEDVDDEAMSSEDARSVTSPETPSVVCHSSFDVTASSLAEPQDTTCRSVSEGELLVTEGEPGECPTARHFPSLVVSGSSGISTPSVCQRSEGEVEESQEVIEEEEEECDDDEEEKEDEEEEEEQSLQVSQQGRIHSHTQSPGVSVVVDESFSSGEAAVVEVVERRRPSFLALQRENEELMGRLRHFGSFSFLLKKSGTLQESSSSGSSSPFSPS